MSIIFCLLLEVNLEVPAAKDLFPDILKPAPTMEDSVSVSPIPEKQSVDVVIQTRVTEDPLSQLTDKVVAPGGEAAQLVLNTVEDNARSAFDPPGVLYLQGLYGGGLPIWQDLLALSPRGKRRYRHRG